MSVLYLIVGVLPRPPERYALIFLLVVAVGGVPVLENPHSSLIMFHERMQWLIKTLRSVKIPET